MPRPDVRALTLWQPWASLVAIGAKRFETRGWGTRYRGAVLIHAAKQVNDEPIEPVALEAMQHALGMKDFRNLPRGDVLAICQLTACHATSIMRPAKDEDEMLFGNYGPGRYTWRLDQVRPLTPFYARGFQGLWIPEDDAIRRALAQVKVA